MAELGKDPKGLELEDFVAAHFVSRGCYVETGVKERSPDEILELDIVWTDFRKNPPERHPVEVKSGDWGLGDVFKFYGWTRYLGLEPGQFVHKEQCGRLGRSSLRHVQDRTGIGFLHVPKPQDAEACFKAIGLPDPATGSLPQLWRYSFWAQRRLLRSVSEAIRKNVCPESSKLAKEYHRLINDAVFFIPDISDRVGELLTAHFTHQELGASASYELETGKAKFSNPPQTATFRRASYSGRHFPVQACLYLGHRARLYIIKALVDFWFAQQRGEVKHPQLRVGGKVIELPYGMTPAMTAGLKELSAAKSFPLLPVFWQVFLWSWGGFLLKDRLDAEYSHLERETGVPKDEIPLALSAFDRIFPTPNGWFREPDADSRRLVMLMPSSMRGIGSLRRRAQYKAKEYKDLGYRDETTYRLVGDHNTTVRLLECAEDQLDT